MSRFDSGQKRDHWKQEDELINHRVSWLGVTQGLLFAAYGLSGTADIRGLLAWAGLLTSALAFFGLCAALLAMHFIHQDGPSDEKRHFGVRHFTTVAGWAAAAGIPLVFFVIWLLILRG